MFKKAQLRFMHVKLTFPIQPLFFRKAKYFYAAKYEFHTFLLPVCMYSRKTILMRYNNKMNRISSF